MLLVTDCDAQDEEMLISVIKQLGNSFLEEQGFKVCKPSSTAQKASTPTTERLKKRETPTDNGGPFTHPEVIVHPEVSCL